MDSKFKNHANKFYYIRGYVVMLIRQAKIADFMKKACHGYFGVKLRDQYKPLVPHICCKTCMENLRDWRNEKRKSMPFGVPAVWRKRKDHVTNF